MGGGGGASVPIKCVKIIKNGRERNRKKVTKTEKKNVNLDGNQQAPYGHRKHRQDFNKAALTELKGEKGRICFQFWMLIVIGSETKKSLSWFLQFRWGLGVEVEVFMRRVKLLFGSTLLQLSSTTGLPASNLAKRQTKFKSYKGRKTL